MKELFNNALRYVLENYSCFLEADDTHRWVDTDGFYEVQFTIKFDNDKSIYLTTVYGGQTLQDEWSHANPQSVNYADFECMMDDWDCEYALGRIREYFAENNINAVEVFGESSSF
jgi:hypothetical protein